MFITHAARLHARVEVADRDPALRLRCGEMAGFENQLGQSNVRLGRIDLDPEVSSDNIVVQLASVGS